MTAEVMALADGSFFYEGPRNRGLAGNMGPSARIRQEGVHRERPLLLQTLGAFASGDVRVVDRRVLDRQDSPTGGLCLNESIAKALEARL